MTNLVQNLLDIAERELDGAAVRLDDAVLDYAGLLGGVAE